MNSQEQQKKRDFLCDLKLLAEQYGYTLDSAMSMLGFKPKGAEDLALEYAQETYKKGVVFIPVNKQKPRVSDGRVQSLCGILWCFDDTGEMRRIKMTISDWAKIVNE